MPDAAYRASIVAIDPPATIGKGQQLKIRLKLTNASDREWVTSGVDESDLWRGNDDDQYRIQLANHWIPVGDQKASHDDGRSRLPDRLGPKETAAMILTVNAPATPGDYILEFDVIQENVTWFAAKGSETARYRVRVE